MNDDIINRYTLMLIKQYWEKPKAKSEIQAMLRHWQIIADFIRNPDNFDLDQVTGYRLDVIGRIIGLARSVPEVIAKIFLVLTGILIQQALVANQMFHLSALHFSENLRQHMVIIS